MKRMRKTTTKTTRKLVNESVSRKSCLCSCCCCCGKQFSISIQMKALICLMMLMLLLVAVEAAAPAAKVEAFTTHKTTMNDLSAATTTNKTITKTNTTTTKTITTATKTITTTTTPSRSITTTTTATNQSSLTASILNRRAWPLKHYDIWNDLSEKDATKGSRRGDVKSIDEPDGVVESLDDDFEYMRDAYGKNGAAEKLTEGRQAKVIHLFPVPVDGECISSDGRRTGTCFNAYECRAKGGASSGECAHGFGVCCIFTAACNVTISNNITYLISPNFPSFMPHNVTACSLKVKLLSDDISQLRVDFQHFSLGQPNRRTGVCDGDAFRMSGGPSGEFSLCGQNSGQHIYYDVGGRFVPRQTLYGSLRPLSYAQIYPNISRNSTDLPTIEIAMIFSERFLPIRLWEIRIAQIPFSQRAPAGCLQYYSGREGVIQTFNYAENGRHLADQNYRICVRQETEMCSIMYQPCDAQSFRIAPNTPVRSGLGSPGTVGVSNNGLNGGSTGIGGAAPANSVASSSNPLGTASTGNPLNPIGSNPPGMASGSTATPTMAALPSTASVAPLADALTDASTNATDAASPTQQSSSTTLQPTDAVSMANSTADTADAVSSSTAAPATSSAAMPDSTAPPTSTTAAPSSTTPLTDDIEGSGDDFVPETASRRPRPVSGGFDILGFLRHAFDFGLGRSAAGDRKRSRTRRQFDSPTQLRQFYSGCMDRITMPCIVEDFIGPAAGGLGIPDCEPIHCGDSFCSSGEWPCRIESTVTPFYLTVHFGRGANKGSPEDNIGACLRYTQVQCL